MNMFTRTAVPPGAVAAEELAKDVPRRVHSHGDYAPYISIDTGVSEYDAQTTLAGLDQALGRRITRHLLADDAESALNVGASVLRDHAREANPASDLQTTLLVNIVKELAGNEAETFAERKAHCEELLRRCTLAPDYKKHVLENLTTGNTLDTPFLVTVAHG